MNLNEMTTENLVAFAEEAFQAGDEAQVELIIAELEERGDEQEAFDIQTVLDIRRSK